MIAFFYFMTGVICSLDNHWQLYFVISVGQKIQLTQITVCDVRLNPYLTVTIKRKYKTTQQQYQMIHCHTSEERPLIHPASIKCSNCMKNTSIIDTSVHSFPQRSNACLTQGRINAAHTLFTLSMSLAQDYDGRYHQVVCFPDSFSLAVAERAKSLSLAELKSPGSKLLDRGLIVEETASCAALYLIGSDARVF